MTITICRLYVVALLLLTLAATTTHATTWTVEADGSGDFPTIQAAMDAAESGDVIQLGAGVFDHYGPDPGWPSHDLYVKVWTDVTIVGSGRDQTSIGRQDSDHHDAAVDDVITGDTAAILVHRVIETEEFHHNHILSGGGWTVQAGWWYGGGGELDLAHNWWGTDDPQQIADSILDHEDDPEILLEVVFSPFLDEPTGTEQRSLSDIKALFR